MTTSDTTTATITNELLIDHLDQASYDGKGRREFLRYRDVGLGTATGGQFRMLGMKATGENEPTGWHYHVCDVQFVYVLQGWVELEFEGGRTEKLVAGSFASIPGGMLHNEKNLSPDLEVLEICSPADMGTVPVDPPQG
ncbi:MAG: cupin domain-containing protein [Acidimicrobiales bacterium]|nr:cupin domain-containing protein [Acidimicrobiales bacterium]